MIKFTEFELIKLIEDDLRFEDCTTYIQEIDCNAKLEIFSREDLYLSCIDTVKDIARMMDVEVVFSGKNGEFIRSGATIIALKSSYENIHKIWKIVQILLEWSCKISTYTRLMCNKAQSINKYCQILTTRKSFPFSKKLCIKSVMEGGGNIHRHGLDDSVLFFNNHIKVYENFGKFCEQIPIFKSKLPEKKIIVEADSKDKAIQLLKAGADGIQCDKMEICDIKSIVAVKNQHYKNVIITASGGINLNNIQDFVATGIDGAVTSAPYAQGMADLSAKIFII